MLIRRFVSFWVACVKSYHARPKACYIFISSYCIHIIYRYIIHSNNFYNKVSVLIIPKTPYTDRQCRTNTLMSRMSWDYHHVVYALQDCFKGITLIIIGELLLNFALRASLSLLYICKGPSAVISSSNMCNHPWLFYFYIKWSWNVWVVFKKISVYIIYPLNDLRYFTQVPRNADVIPRLSA